MKSAHLNNFDFLRIAAAILVFISHAFCIYGKDELKLLSSGFGFSGITLGTLGTSMFFAISGYLIAQSWVRTQALIPFLKKRILRLYPAIIVNFLVVTFVIAPAASILDISAYFQAAFWQIPQLMLGSFAFKMPDLPGVFLSSPIPHAVNVPLWTLVFEALCYLVICACGIISDVKKILPCLTAVYVLCFFDKIFFPKFDTDLGLIYCATFLLGACFCLYEQQVKYHHGLALLCFSSLLALMLSNTYWLPVYALTTTYLTLYAALYTRYLGNFARYGDFSYGLYIYAWPLQQTCAVLFHFEPAMFYIFTLSSFLVTFIFAALSWHSVERRALAYK